MELNEGAAILPFASDPPPLSELDRLVSVVTQMQEGINTILDIMVQQKAEIVTLQVEVRRLKARTDAPSRPSIIHPGNAKWRS